MATPPPVQQMTLEQFGQTVKAKHPEYNDLSDADVATKVIAKYPQYKDMVSSITPAATPPEDTRNLYQRSRDAYNAATKPYTETQEHQVPHSMGELGTEVGKGVGNIGAGLYGAVLHPLDTAGNLIKSAVMSAPPVEAVQSIRGLMNGGQTKPASQQFAEQAVQHPLETAEGAIGQAAAMGAASKIIPATVSKLKPGNLYPTSQSLAADTSAARNLGQAIPRQTLPMQPSRRRIPFNSITTLSLTQTQSRLWLFLRTIVVQKLGKDRMPLSGLSMIALT